MLGRPESRFSQRLQIRRRHRQRRYQSRQRCASCRRSRLHRLAASSRTRDLAASRVAYPHIFIVCLAGTSGLLAGLAEEITSRQSICSRHLHRHCRSRLAHLRGLRRFGRLGQLRFGRRYRGRLNRHSRRHLYSLRRCNLRLNHSIHQPDAHRQIASAPCAYCARCSVSEFPSTVTLSVSPFSV